VTGNVNTLTFCFVVVGCKPLEEQGNARTSSEFLHQGMGGHRYVTGEKAGTIDCGSSATKAEIVRAELPVLSGK